MKRKYFYLSAAMLINYIGAFAQDVTLVCSICNGHGMRECTLCEGKGKWKTEIDGKKRKVECPACNGRETQPCWLCNGTGKDIIIMSPPTNNSHPNDYSWLWCHSCKQKGVTCCTRCQGRGMVYADNGKDAVCSLCNGKRFVLCSSCNGSCGWYVNRYKCEVCEGNGSLTCSQCNGQGWLPPEHVEKAYAEVCKQCKGHGMISHKECEGKGCKQCKNGEMKCKQCKGHGAVIMTPEPKYKECVKCSHKGVQRCNACSGKGYRDVTTEGIIVR